MIDDFKYTGKGPWIVHDGMDQPYELQEDVVEVVRRGPDHDEWLRAESHHINWNWNGGHNDVLLWKRVHG